MMLRKCTALALALLVLAALFCSCGDSGKAVDVESISESPEYEYDMNYSVAERGYSGLEDKMYPTKKSDGTSAVPASPDEKIIRTVTLVAETKEFDETLEKLRASLKAAGGYEENFSSDGKSYNMNYVFCRTAQMVLRLPSSSLDSFLDGFDSIANVTSEYSANTNVTEEYYDIESRLSVLREEKASYEKMLEAAKDTDSLLKIKERLYDVIAEIESAQTRLNHLDSKVNYSTVTVTLREVVDYSEVTTTKTSFGSRIAKAFRRSWENFASDFQSFVVWFVGAVPTLLVLAAIGVGIFFLVRYLIKRNRRKKD